MKTSCHSGEWLITESLPFDSLLHHDIRFECENGEIDCIKILVSVDKLNLPLLRVKRFLSYEYAILVLI